MRPQRVSSVKESIPRAGRHQSRHRCIASSNTTSLKVRHLEQVRRRIQRSKAAAKRCMPIEDAVKAISRIHCGRSYEYKTSFDQKAFAFLRFSARYAHFKSVQGETALSESFEEIIHRLSATVYLLMQRNKAARFNDQMILAITESLAFCHKRLLSFCLLPLGCESFLV